MTDLFELLRHNSYPGRGIVLGRTADATIAAYFIMGRSVNSRNRVFVEDGAGIRTEAQDPALLTDPSLIIYAPVRVVEGGGGDITVVTNGDQTDTVCDALVSGGSFESALRTREYEPDAPNYTPRISGIAYSNGGYTLSLLKKAEGGDGCIRFFYEFSQPLSGQGHFVSTYRSDGDPLPSFEGEPIAVEIEGSVQDFALKLWESLDEDNRVSLFVRSIPDGGGESETRIFNKYGVTF